MVKGGDIEDCRRPSKAGLTPNGSKRGEAKVARTTMLGPVARGDRRDPAIEVILAARKFTIVENSYTRLANVSFPGLKQMQHINISDIRPSTGDAERELAQRALSAKKKNKAFSWSSSDSDDDDLDEKESGDPSKGLCASSDEWKESIRPVLGSSREKSDVQLYEEKCQELNICPSSVVQRSLVTTEMNLQNYGLGARGCRALSVALLVSSSTSSRARVHNGCNDRAA